MTCGRRWEIQAIDEGRLGPDDVAAFERHSATCPSCLEEAQALGHLRSLAAELRAPVARELDLRRLRARVLRDAMHASSPPPRRSLHAALALAAVATAAFAFAMPHRRASTAQSNSSAMESPSPVAADFPIGAVGVELRETLPSSAPGESPARVLPPEALRPASPSTALPESAPAVAVESRADAEMEDYQRAVDDYRLGRFTEAATLLRVFVDRYPTSTVLDDAWFIEASSLASEGLADDAAKVAEAHLARFPASFHRKQAAILVARGRRDRGDCAGARAALAAWSGDPSTLSELGRCNR